MPCHSALRQRSGLRLDTAALLIQGGDSGSAIVPGNSHDSLLVSMLTGESGVRMPPEEEGAALSDANRTHQEMDRPGRTGTRGADAARSSRPLVVPPARATCRSARDGINRWVRNPVDAFLAAGHESHGAHAGRSGRQGERCCGASISILIGLPPTRDELAAFLADDSPHAYENVVDRSARQPAIRRALGPALDGRVALQRLVRLQAGSPQQRAAHLAVARLDHRIAQRRQRLRPDGASRCWPATSSRRPIRTRCGRPASSSATGTSSIATRGSKTPSSTRPRHFSA